MAKKDFDKYVQVIINQYKDFENVLKTLSEEANANMTDISFVDDLKAQMLPLKQNYERIMYIKYLLDLPNRKEKQESYKRRTKKFISTLNASNSCNAVIDENNKIIENIKNN